MKITLLFPLLGLTVLLFTGCASQPTQYVDPNSSRMVTTVGQINVQDFAQAADTMTQSLIDNFVNAGKLELPAGRPVAVMAVSRIVNNTGQQIDTDLLIKKIRIALNRTGKVVTTTTVGVGGTAEDPLAKEAIAADQLLTDKKVLSTPDYTLSGKIIQDMVRAGSVRQSSFVFQLSLTKAGLAIWEEEKTITKQGTRGSVGF